MLTVDSIYSPMFWLLIAASLAAILIAVQGLIRGELPTMRTSYRGARIAGVFAVIALIFVLLSFWVQLEYNSVKRGMVFLTVAAIAFGTGLFLAQRTTEY